MTIAKAPKGPPSRGVSSQNPHEQIVSKLYSSLALNETFYGRPEATIAHLGALTVCTGPAGREKCFFLILKSRSGPPGGPVE
jgi:hypothetical protein